MLPAILRVLQAARRDRLTIAAGSEKPVDAFTEQEVTRILFYVQQPSYYAMRSRLIVEMLLGYASQ